MNTSDWYRFACGATLMLALTTSAAWAQTRGSIVAIPPPAQSSEWWHM
jgi:hypothetical protein